MRRIAIIPGDGIGPEVTAEAVKAIKAVQERSGLDLELVDFNFGADKFLQTGITIPEEQIADFRKNYDAIFMGPLGDPRILDPVYANRFRSQLYQKLDLFISLHPVKLLDARYCPLKDKEKQAIDIALLIETGEGACLGMGGTFRKGTEDEVIFRQYLNTYKGVERFIRHSFEYTRRQGRKKLAMSIKCTAIMNEIGLWENLIERLSGEYPEIEISCLTVNSLVRQLIKNPENFEVIITNNAYGEVIAETAIQLVGGPGLASNAVFNPGKLSLFSPGHGSLARRAGQNVANPLGAISSVALMLDHLGFEQEARWINCAVKYTLETNNTTRDLGGRLGTSQVGDFIANQIKKGAC
jgi:3-isopropylmalate dehydrogenase